MDGADPQVVLERTTRPKFNLSRAFRPSKKELKKTNLREVKELYNGLNVII